MLTDRKTRCLCNCSSISRPQNSNISNDFRLRPRTIRWECYLQKWLSSCKRCQQKDWRNQNLSLASAATISIVEAVILLCKLTGIPLSQVLASWGVSGLRVASTMDSWLIQRQQLRTLGQLRIRKHCQLSDSRRHQRLSSRWRSLRQPRQLLTQTKMSSTVEGAQKRP